MDPDRPRCTCWRPVYHLVCDHPGGTGVCTIHTRVSRREARTRGKRRRGMCVQVTRSGGRWSGVRVILSPLTILKLLLRFFFLCIIYLHSLLLSIQYRVWSFSPYLIHYVLKFSFSSRIGFPRRKVSVPIKITDLQNPFGVFLETRYSDFRNIILFTGK